MHHFTAVSFENNKKGICFHVEETFHFKHLTYSPQALFQNSLVKTRGRSNPLS